MYQGYIIGNNKYVYKWPITPKLIAICPVNIDIKELNRLITLYTKMTNTWG